MCLAKEKVAMPVTEERVKEMKEMKTRTTKAWACSFVWRHQQALAYVELGYLGKEQRNERNGLRLALLDVL